MARAPAGIERGTVKGHFIALTSLIWQGIGASPNSHRLNGTYQPRSSRKPDQRCQMDTPRWQIYQERFSFLPCHLGICVWSHHHSRSSILTQMSPKEVYRASSWGLGEHGGKSQQEPLCCKFALLLGWNGGKRTVMLLVCHEHGSRY